MQLVRGQTAIDAVSTLEVRGTPFSSVAAAANQQFTMNSYLEREVTMNVTAGQGSTLTARNHTYLDNLVNGLRVNFTLAWNLDPSPLYDGYFKKVNASTPLGYFKPGALVAESYSVAVNLSQTWRTNLSALYPGFPVTSVKVLIRHVWSDQGGSIGEVALNATANSTYATSYSVNTTLPRPPTSTSIEFSVTWLQDNRTRFNGFTLTALDGNLNDSPYSDRSLATLETQIILEGAVFPDLPVVTVVLITVGMLVIRQLRMSLGKTRSPDQLSRESRGADNQKA